jgi:Tol biopolymer transport system component
MGLAPGVRLGPYEVVSPLGAGGMGEVYRARDTRIGRDVAVKVLPTGLAQDAGRLRRFEQEARATGQLNHPNILALYDLGEHDGLAYVVSELLEGQTLRERLGGAALHVRKAVEVGAQIARGLAAAHEKGIVHRDLKPDNVFVTKDGQVKILDFGLAKLTLPEFSTSQGSQLETEAHGTDPGTVLGTVGYMSPEQVRGRAVDHRSDIFSFGAILYEMLAGRRAFTGDSAIETLNAILKEEPPDFALTNKALPPALERIVRHCLEKNPDERFASARDLAFDLQAVSETSIEARVAAPRGRRRHLTTVVALGLASLATGVGGFLLGRRTAAAPQPSFRLLTFRRGNVVSARFAPDGQTFFYSGHWGEGLRAHVAALDSPEPRSLEPPGIVAGAAAGEVALIVPKGDRTTLVQAPVSGGSPREVASDVLVADWTRSGEFALVREQAGRQRIEFPRGRVIYETPNRVHFLRASPTGRHLAFFDRLRGYENGSLHIIDASGASVLTSGAWYTIIAVAWSPDGREVWLTGGKTSQRLSVWAIALGGAERVLYQGADPLRILDVRPDGRVLAASGRHRYEMAFGTRGDPVEKDLTWLGRSYVSDLSNDGRNVVFEDGQFAKDSHYMFLRRVDGTAPVQLGQGSPSGLSPDGRWAIGFPGLQDDAQRSLAVVPTGAGESRTLPRGRIDRYLDAFWYPDGRRILVVAHEKDRPVRLFEQDVERGEPTPVTPEGVSTNDPTLAPDASGVLARSLEPGSPFRFYPLSGGDPRPIPGLRDDDAPFRFDATGRFVFLREPVPAAEARVVVVRFDTRTGTREPWLEIRPADRVGIGAFPAVRLSADGRSYVYSCFRELTNLFLVEGLR